MNEEIDIQKEIDSLSKMIKAPVDRSVLEEELDRYLNKYLMDLESSKRAIIKDHGGSDDDYKSPMVDYCQISELTNGITRSLIAKVNDCRQIVTKTGKTILKIKASDNSGSVLIDVWDTEPVTEQGKVYTFKNCRIKYDNYAGCLVATCRKSDIEENGEIQIDPSFNKIRSLSIREDELRDGLNNVVIYGFVTTILPPSGRPNAPKMTGFFNIGDNDYRFVTWAELPLEEDVVVCIDKVSVSFNTYVKQLELKFSNNSTIYEED